MIGMRLNKSIGLVALAAIPILLAPSLGRANVTYTYTGNAFTDNYQANPPPSPGYTEVTGTITLASAFAPSTTNSTVADILAWSFSDGVDSLNNTNSTIITGAVGFGFFTNASGDISQWVFEVGNLSTTAEITTVNAPSSGLVLDEGTGDSSNPAAPGGTNFMDAGSWVLNSQTCTSNCGTTVPEPSFAVLLAACLVAFCIFPRKTR